MSDAAISVRDLSKQYIRGPDRAVTAGQVVANALLEPYRKLRGQPRRAAGNSQKREPFWALKDVSFDVEPGARVGIIGRNGAGKSTLLKILSRIVYPTTGEARIRGRVASLLEVGTGFNPNLSGRENIYLNASIYGLERREIDVRFENIVEFSGIREFLDTPVRHYSSGMFMRLAFSVAAHLDPDILLLDEVLAVGDLSFQQKCLQRVEGLTSEGRTVLFVSHTLDAIVRLCDRCLWLDQGRVIMDGPVTSVVEAYVGVVLGVTPRRQWVAEALPPADEASAPVTASSSSALSRDGKEVEELTGDTGTSIGTKKSGGSDAPSTEAVAGDEHVRLVSARVINSHRLTVTTVAIDEPVGIEVVYEILKKGKNIQPALHFKTANDSYAFVVAYTDPATMLAIPEPGRYQAIAWVPPDLLNAGILYVSVIMVTPDPLERHIIVERAVSFNVHERLDGATETARGLYARGFPGVVRPKLRWETQRLGGSQRFQDQHATAAKTSPSSDDTLTTPALRLFDEPYYIKINEARWAMAREVLTQVRDRCSLALSTCLDVGCGPGWFSQKLADLGLNVEGIDGRWENVETARRRAPGLQFHHGNIESDVETAALGQFDLVFCFGLLYHTENPFRVIRTLHRLTRKVLFVESIVAPEDSAGAWLVDENSNETQGLTTYSLIPSRAGMLKMLHASGFKHVYEFLGPVQHDDFREMAARHRKRRVFLASTAALTLDQIVPAPEIATPKYDSAKKV